MSETPTKFLGIRMPRTLARKMEQVLEGEGLMIAEYVKGLVRDDLRKRGLLSPNDDGEQSAAAPAAQPSTTEVGV